MTAHSVIHDTGDEQEEYFVNRLKQPSTHLMGRICYEGAAQHFPTGTGPVAAAGEGAPLFTGLPHPLALRLVSSTAFPSGILELVYLPAAV